MIDFQLVRVLFHRESEMIPLVGGEGPRRKKIMTASGAELDAVKSVRSVIQGYFIETPGVITGNGPVGAVIGIEPGIEPHHKGQGTGN